MSRNTRKGTRRSDLGNRRGRSSLKVRAFKLLKKFGLVFGLLVLVVWLGAWFFLSGTANKSWNAVERTIVKNAAEQGFRVENILIEGRYHTDLNLLKAIINTKEGDPILDFDPEEIQPLIQRISWVKKATVLRLMPSTIHILLEEYEPYALWQNAGQVAVIGYDGTVLTKKLEDDFKDLIILTGEQAPQKAAGLIEILKVEPIIAQQVEGAILISDRRWDLKLKNGKTVSLPEDDIGYALRRLVAEQEKTQILDKDISLIDLREANRIIVEGR